jgi:hypothetical protein
MRIAAWTGHPGYFWAQMAGFYRHNAMLYYQDPGTGLMIYVTNEAVDPAHPNFPFGYPVEPDR